MDTLLLIGAGNMGRTIAEGGIRAGVIDPQRLVVLEPNSERRVGFAHASADAHEGVRMIEAMGGEGRVLLAIKPQMLASASRDLAPLLAGRGRTIVSILAGTTLDTLEASFGPANRYVRVMPNTPASVGRGMSAICARSPQAGAHQDGLAFARRLFGAMGEVIDIDESLMDAFTAIAGSGPAYAFLLAESMVRAACAMGFDDTSARLIVSETIAGAGLLLARGPRDARALREGVTSPGGTTAAALRVLREAGFADIVGQAVLAARDRGAELGARTGATPGSG